MLLPGASIHDALRVLEDVRQAGSRQLALTSDPERLLIGYLGWARDGADRLTSILTAEQIRDLLLTPTYWSLLNATTSRGATYVIVQAELQSRGRGLEAASSELGQQRERWSVGFGPLVVLDTGVFIEHALEFPMVLGAIEDAVCPRDQTDRWVDGSPVQFVVPLQVVDELDKQKADRSRGRARTALARLNEAFDDPRRPAKLDNLREGSSVHLLMDTLQHERLAEPDNEIVDRALYLQAVSGGGPGSVAVAVMDTGMDLRVRMAGLRSFLLRDRRDEPGVKKGGHTASAGPHRN